MIKGKRYRVTFLIPGKRKLMTWDWVYLGGELWDARPGAGTQRIPRNWIESTEEIEDAVQE